MYSEECFIDLSKGCRSSKVFISGFLGETMLTLVVLGFDFSLMLSNPFHPRQEETTHFHCTFIKIYNLFKDVLEPRRHTNLTRGNLKDTFLQPSSDDSDVPHPL